MASIRPSRAMTKSVPATEGPLDRLDDWDEFLKSRYPAEGSGKQADQFRDHRGDAALRHLIDHLDRSNPRELGKVLMMPIEPIERRSKLSAMAA